MLRSKGDGSSWSSLSPFPRNHITHQPRYSVGSLLLFWTGGRRLRVSSYISPFTSFIMTLLTHLHTWLCRHKSFRWFVTPSTNCSSCWWGWIWLFSNHFLTFPFWWLIASRSLSASRWKDGFRWLMNRYIFHLSHWNLHPIITVKSCFRWIIASPENLFNCRKPVLSVANEIP